ncbi:MAG: hypothetical protein ABI977_33305 [Acidobacteriota bacterium]
MRLPVLKAAAGTQIFAASKSLALPSSKVKAAYSLISSVLLAAGIFAAGIF